MGLVVLGVFLAAAAHFFCWLARIGRVWVDGIMSEFPLLQVGAWWGCIPVDGLIDASSWGGVSMR